MSSANSKPKAAPVVVVKELPNENKKNVVRLIPAFLASLLFNGGLMGLMMLIFQTPPAAPALEPPKDEPQVVNADPPEEKPSNDPFLTTDIDPAAQEFDTDIQYAVDRKDNVSVPGMVNPNEAVGIMDAPKDAPLTNLPAPGGFGQKGQGGTILESDVGTGTGIGMPGGYGPRGLPLAGSFYGRSGSTREWALKDGGGTKESEAAVARGLQFLARHQMPDGSWKLDDPRFKDKGGANDIAGTAFGLLPLLGAGKTHRPSKDNPYDKPIEKALLFLMRKQDKRTGNFGGGMYAHALATIAMCEAYGLSQDPMLRKPAQMAANYLVQAQHDGGGWRYSPGQAGDTSVVGWVVMALKSAQMAGLDVPEVTMRKARNYLDGACNTGDEGYGYVGPGSSPTMSAVGLLCRQYLQSWGPQNLRMIKGVDNHIKKNGPLAKNMYYNYYATQVMHHFGGESWKKWNEKMREQLIGSQEKNGPLSGSWNSVGDHHSAGRLMTTSLSLLTLEVYYRHLPLYYRDAGDKRMAAAGN